MIVNKMLTIGSLIRTQSVIGYSVYDQSLFFNQWHQILVVWLVEIICTAMNQGSKKFSQLNADVHILLK